MEKRQIVGVISSLVLALWAIPFAYGMASNGYDPGYIVKVCGFALTAIALISLWE